MDNKKKFDTDIGKQARKNVCRKCQDYKWCLEMEGFCSDFTIELSKLTERRLRK